MFRKLYVKFALYSLRHVKYDSITPFKVLKIKMAKLKLGFLVP